MRDNEWKSQKDEANWNDDAERDSEIQQNQYIYKNTCACEKLFDVIRAGANEKTVESKEADDKADSKDNVGKEHRIC